MYPRRLAFHLLPVCITLVHCAVPAHSAGVISDIFDYRLVGANFPVQFLYDDTLTRPEFQQGPTPILTLANPGIAAPREVWFLEPGDLDANDPSLISDIVAIRPIAGNKLELHFWTDDPTVTAAQFRASLGLTGAPVATIVEDGLAHDINAALFGIVPASPFLHVIVASDLLDQGILPGVPGGGGGGGGGIAISETLAFRGSNGRILNQGMHGAAFYDAPGFGEADASVFTMTVTTGAFQNTAILFNEGLFPDPNDNPAVPADLLTMTVAGGNPLTGLCDVNNPCILTFGEWSEDPGGIPNLAGYNQLGPFDETLPDNVPGSHPPLIDLFGLRGATVTFTDFNGVVQADTLTAIDFKSDPPVPEPSVWSLVMGGLACLWLRRRSKTHCRCARALERRRTSGE